MCCTISVDSKFNLFKLFRAVSATESKPIVFSIRNPLYNHESLLDPVYYIKAIKLTEAVIFL